MNPEEIKKHQDEVLAALSNGHIGFNAEEEAIYRDIIAVSLRLLMLDGRWRG